MAALAANALAVLGHRVVRRRRRSLLILLMAAAGLFQGLAMPSRDMLVRAVTPPGSFGKVFGFVTTGFNIAGMVAPLIFGWLMDQGHPQAVLLRLGRLRPRHHPDRDGDAWRVADSRRRRRTPRTTCAASQHCDGQRPDRAGRRVVRTLRPDD